MEMEELQVIGELEPKLGQISNRSGSDSGMEIVEEVEVTNNKMSNSDSDSQRKNGKLTLIITHTLYCRQ